MRLGIGINGQGNAPRLLLLVHHFRRRQDLAHRRPGVGPVKSSIQGTKIAKVTNEIDQYLHLPMKNAVAAAAAEDPLQRIEKGLGKRRNGKKAKRDLIRLKAGRKIASIEK